jgi:hypothetical protein
MLLVEAPPTVRVPAIPLSDSFRQPSEFQAIPRFGRVAGVKGRI